MFKLSISLVVIILLAGCATSSNEEITVSGNRIASQKKATVLPYLVSQATPAYKDTYDDQLHIWVDKIRAFHAANPRDIKAKYFSALTQLENWPNEQGCNQAFDDTVNVALQYNPTSMWAHAMAVECATRKGQSETVEIHKAAIKNINAVLTHGRNGKSPEQAFFIRDIYDARMMLTLRGKRLIDTEIKVIDDQFFTVLHALDDVNRVYEQLYATAQNFTRESYHGLTSEDYRDRDVLQLYMATTIYSQNDASIKGMMRRALRQGEFERVIKRFQAEANLSPLEVTFYGLALVSINQPIPERITNQMEDMAQLGLADALAFQSAQLFNSTSPDDHEHGWYLFTELVSHVNVELASEIWLNTALIIPNARNIIDKFLAINQIEQTQQSFIKAITKSAKWLKKDTPAVNNYLTLISLLREHQYPKADLLQAKLFMFGELGQTVDRDAGIRALTLAAQNSDAEAQVNLGVIYSTGDFGLTQDYAKATEWYEKSYAQDHPSAAFNLANAYRYGRHVKKDLIKAIALYEQAGELGQSQGYCEAGDIHRYEMPEPDYEKALAFYRKGINATLDKAKKSTCYFGLGLLNTFTLNKPDIGLIQLRQAGDLGVHEAYHRIGIYYQYHSKQEDNYEKTALYLAKAVSLNNAQAAVSLGYLYETGRGVEQNQTKALEYYKIAARGRSHRGLNNLASFIRHGIATEKDPIAAIKLYEKALALGNVFSAHHLADMYWDGEGVERDYVKACNFYSQAVALKVEKSRYDLAYCYYTGKGKAQNHASAVEILNTDLENDYSMQLLGTAYEEGKGVEQNTEQARRWFSKSAEQGNAIAMFKMGKNLLNEEQYDDALSWFNQAKAKGHIGGSTYTASMYWQGLGTVANPEKALFILKEQAEQRKTNANTLIGNVFFFGHFGSKDYINALHYFNKAAEQNDPVALNNLGEMYRNGWGVNVDYQKARELYELADFLGGNGHAAFNLGEMYRDGLGVDPNPKRALTWFKRADQLGLVNAKVELGKAYLKGLGTEVDEGKAISLLEQAARNDSFDAMIELAESLLKRTDRQSIQQAKFWLKLAASNGVEKAKSRLKGELPLSL